MAEGSVGGGTGMVTFEWKGGIGTASRVVVMPAVEGGTGPLLPSACWCRPTTVGAAICCILGAPVGP